MPLAHLLRGTLKVVGSAALNPQPAAFGIFYVNETSPFPAEPATPSGSAESIASPCRIKRPGWAGIFHEKETAYTIFIRSDR